MSEATNRWNGRAARIVLTTVVLSMAVVVVALVPLASSPPPAMAHDGDEHGEDGEASPLSIRVPGQATTCPALTDSIRRVYLVALGREPEDSELVSASARYGSGEASLELLASELLSSAEYVDFYGELDDDAFIVEAHRTALGQAPDMADRQRWLELLSGDVSRARLVLLLAESEPVVMATNTHEPLAGYLQWYPQGSHWYCGAGIANELPIQPLTNAALFADVLFTNSGSSQDVIAVRTTLGGVPNIVIQQGSLPPGFTSYTWGGVFSGAESYGTHLDIRAGQDTSWAVVFYPSELPDRRAGWQITR